MPSLSPSRAIAAIFLLITTAVLPQVVSAQISESGDSQVISWECVGSDCPWGATVSGQALVWPDSAEPSSGRLGYQTSQPAYLPASRANEAIVWIDSGSASIYAGAPDAQSHRLLASVSAGGYHIVSGLADDEVLSVQSPGAFSYQFDLPPEPGSEVPGGDNTSELVTWTCTGTNCPWGSPVVGQALVWPAVATPAASRLGYTTSHGIYLDASYANGASIGITRGSATLYAGRPDDFALRTLATLSAGNTYAVSGLSDGEFLSVQSEYEEFDYDFTLGDPADNPPTTSPPTTFEDSTWTTWSCEYSSCSWGATIGAHSVVWPGGTVSGNQGYDYSTTASVYLDAEYANGATVWISQGVAHVYIGTYGQPWATRTASVGAGESFAVNGLASNQYLSVSNDYDAFRFAIQYATTPPDGPPPDDPPPDDPPPDDPPPTGSVSTQWVTWNCSQSCDWGSSIGAHSVIWDADMAVQEQSFRYSTTANVYLNSENANGLKITITEGTAYVYVGTEGQPWMGTLAAVNAGESFTVQGLSPTTFLSVSNDFDAFSYVLEFAPVIDPPSPDPEDVVYSVPGNWRCDIAECTGSDWLGSVVNWPSWAAYPNNARTGNNSRTTYGDSGELLYPYMGSWADGCQVNAISGTVLIIEWERGTDVWDETYIYPGQSYVIDLVGAQNGALIEANGAGSAFSVTLENCEPQPLP